MNIIWYLRFHSLYLNETTKITIKIIANKRKRTEDDDDDDDDTINKNMIEV